MTVSKMLQKIDELDFTLLKLKLQDPEEGKGWDSEYVDIVCEEYKKFLFLTKKYSQKAIVPSNIIDTFWHYHILDTQAYEEDCQKVFGHFLHHFPYFGMRGEQDATNLQTAWNQTKELYEKHFGELPEDLWGDGARCPKCGRVEGEFTLPRTMIFDQPLTQVIQ